MRQFRHQWGIRERYDIDRKGNVSYLACAKCDAGARGNPCMKQGASTPKAKVNRRRRAIRARRVLAMPKPALTTSVPAMGQNYRDALRTSVRRIRAESPGLGVHKIAAQLNVSHRTVRGLLAKVA